MPVKVGIIGCGAITVHRHGPEYANNKDCSIVAFCDPLVDRARQMAKLYGGDSYDNYKYILENPEIDAISVCSSNNTHAKITMEALKAGKHVLCEKPMAINSEEAKDMIRVANESNKFLMIGHNQRLISAHKKVKAILERGDMGKVITFRTSFKHTGPESWSADKSKNTWFYRKDAAFFGVLGDLGIHKIDLIQWLLGQKIIEVSAKIGTLNKRNSNGDLIEVEDNALGIFKTSGGILGTIEVSWTNYGLEDNSTVIYCENGVIKIANDPKYDVVLEMIGGESIYYKTGGISTNTNQLTSGVIDSFIYSIINNEKPDISGEEGYKSLIVIEACITSSKESRWVTIDHNI